MKKDKRKPLNVGPIPKNPYDLLTWTSEQIRLAGAWSKHELESKMDEKTTAYDWVPDWIGNMDAVTVNGLVQAWYARKF